MKAQGHNPLDGDTISERPWGNYIKLYQESGVWVKRVMVNPGMRLSLQKHRRRSEKWIVVQGQALVTIDGQDHVLGKGSIIDVPLGAVHRIQNTSKEKLIFIEVATGDALSESDIERLQDDYERKA